MKRRPRIQPEIAKEILDYFLRNANAADDLEGIVRFRLLEQAIFRCVTEVSEALEWLVATGLLKKAAASSSRTLFSLNESMRGEAEQFVNDGAVPR